MTVNLIDVYTNTGYQYGTTLPAPNSGSVPTLDKRDDSVIELCASGPSTGTWRRTYMVLASDGNYWRLLATVVLSNTNPVAAVQEIVCGAERFMAWSPGNGTWAINGGESVTISGDTAPVAGVAITLAGA